MGFSGLKRRLGSPEKKAPLVRSNFAHLILPATKPQSRGVPQQLVHFYLPSIFQRFYPVSTFILKQSRFSPPSESALSSRVAFPCLSRRRPATCPSARPQTSCPQSRLSCLPRYRISAGWEAVSGENRPWGPSTKNATSDPRSAGSIPG